MAEIDELSIIGDDCQIKPGARIINSVLGQGCFVEERAVVENSVIWPHTRIGTAAEITSAIVGRGCHIGRSAIIRSGTVLGDKTSLTDYTDHRRFRVSDDLAQIKFGTDGWRAIIARDFTFANLERVAQAYAEYLKQQSPSTKPFVVVGFDRRFLSEQFAQRAAEIMAGNGFETELFEEAQPTPVISWAVKDLQAQRWHNDHRLAQSRHLQRF